MASIESLIYDMSRMTYQQKVDTGVKEYFKVIEIIETYRRGYFFVPSYKVAMWYFTIFCGVDRRITLEEHKYFVDISGSRGMSYDHFYYEASENQHPEIQADLRRFMDKLDNEDLGHFQKMAALIFSLKSSPTYDERQFLINYFRKF